MKANLIRNALLGMALFAATAAAQDQDSLQPPPAPQAPLAPQAPPAPLAPLAPQVRELNITPFAGGTYLGVSLAEIDANRAKELKLKEDYGVEITRVEEG